MAPPGLSERCPSVVLPGSPGGPLRLVCRGGSWSVVGADDDLSVEEKPGESGLCDADVLGWRNHVLSFRQGWRRRERAPLWEEESPPEGDEPRLATLNGKLARQLETLVRVARSLVPVHITGETGTGKEVVARAVHRYSRRTGPFVAVNCGALAESLIHSQLFGHQKGAFSGATEASNGFLRASHKGTIFLDEVAELPLGTQATLLRVLQELEVCPLGSTKPQKVDLRVVSATNQSLPALVAAGRFRADLYARLLGFSIELPPLRERPEDIGLLLASLLRRLAPDPRAVRLATPAALALLRHQWPLNIRELERCLAAALAIADAPIIELEHLPFDVQRPRTATAHRPVMGGGPPLRAPAPPTTRSRPLTPEDERRRAELLELLREFRGNIAAVSAAMGKARMQIHRWIKRYEIDHRRFREAP
jgi:DNA-binding NtrC family response regulator